MFLEEPWFLLLNLLLIPLWWQAWRVRKKFAISYSSLLPLRQGLPRRLRFQGVSQYLILILRSTVLVTLSLALARPELGTQDRKRTSEGLDIMMAIDTSGSMRALDFEVGGQTTNRLIAVKTVIEDFIRERPDDRIGMVVFGSEAFTQAPLTLDHNVLLSFLKAVKIGMAGDATAIGDAIATGAQRLKDLDAKSKLLVLLTDGKNTAGSIDPMVAAKAAVALGIKIYTIGVGKEGKVPIPVDTAFGQQIVYQQGDLDEELLKKIAEASEAQYFRAYDTNSLKNIYETIDRLEKTKIEVKEFVKRDEIFYPFLWAAVLSLFGEIGLALTRFNRIPA